MSKTEFTCSRQDQNDMNSTLSVSDIVNLISPPSKPLIQMTAKMHNVLEKQ